VPSRSADSRPAPPRRTTPLPFSPQLFIDTEGSFRPERIDAIATRFGLEPKFIMENVECCRAYNPDNVEDALKGAAEMLVEQPFRVLVIDSLIAPFRVEYSGRGELAERQQRINVLLNVTAARNSNP
jgi:meiotic recombination protein DMC1